MELKRCSKCKEQKPLEDFHKDKAKKGGLRGYCKPCNSESARRWKEENRAAVRASSRRWYTENREAHLENNRRWREENREAALENTRRWRGENPVRTKASNAVTYALTRSPLDHSELFGGATRVEAIDFTEPFIRERLRLEEETGVEHHIDHIKPLCEGGLHVPENLQVITGAENMTKGPVWFNEDHLTDEDIERLDAEALEFDYAQTDRHQLHAPRASS